MHQPNFMGGDVDDDEGDFEYDEHQQPMAGYFDPQGQQPVGFAPAQGNYDGEELDDGDGADGGCNAFTNNQF